MWKLWKMWKLWEGWESWELWESWEILNAKAPGQSENRFDRGLICWTLTEGQYSLYV